MVCLNLCCRLCRILRRDRCKRRPVNQGLHIRGRCQGSRHAAHIRADLLRRLILDLIILATIKLCGHLLCRLILNIICLTVYHLCRLASDCIRPAVHHSFCLTLDLICPAVHYCRRLVLNLFRPAVHCGRCLVFDSFCHCVHCGCCLCLHRRLLLIGEGSL